MTSNTIKLNWLSGQNQPAENLLGLDSYKKWTCAAPAEKNAVVILQVNSCNTEQLAIMDAVMWVSSKSLDIISFVDKSYTGRC